jgi:hypothetical protein
MELPPREGSVPPCPALVQVADRAAFRGPPEGAMIAFLDPEPAAAVLVGEGLCPVVAVLVASAKADQSISAPKGARFPHPSMLSLTMRFAATRRVRRGCDPRPSSQPVGEGHAPLAQYLAAPNAESRWLRPKDAVACTRRRAGGRYAGICSLTRGAVMGADWVQITVIIAPLAPTPGPLGISSQSDHAPFRAVLRASEKTGRSDRRPASGFPGVWARIGHRG